MPDVWSCLHSCLQSWLCHRESRAWRVVGRPGALGVIAWAGVRLRASSLKRGRVTRGCGGGAGLVCGSFAGFLVKPCTG